MSLDDALNIGRIIATLDAPAFAGLAGLALWRVYVLLRRRLDKEADARRADRASFLAAVHAIERRADVAAAEAKSQAVVLQRHLEQDRQDFAELRTVVLELAGAGGGRR